MVDAVTLAQPSTTAPFIAQATPAERLKHVVSVISGYRFRYANET